MPAAAYRYSYRPPLKDRLSAIALAVGICALILFLLIQMGWIAQGPGDPAGKLTAISLRPEASQQPERRKVGAIAKQTQRPEPTQPRPVPQVQPKPELELPPSFIRLTRQEFAAADISKLGRRRPDNIGDGGDSASASSPGEGPGGARLYNAEWYREPTRAEMITYMPKRGVSVGWAMIACKTQTEFRVEDCREMGESPPGSGLARTLRQAAWQFKVRPPRIDGKPLIGAWVRIQFDFTRAKEGEAEDAAGG